LLFRFPENLDAQAREEHVHFVLKFQQFTGPIMAKGLEDTVFYIYNRLAALNEVGGEPQQFGLSVDAFHQRNLDRHLHWPATLLATSTHDTKRSEDVRARMLAIFGDSGIVAALFAALANGKSPLEERRHESEAPDPDEEYCSIKTLLGNWPVAAKWSAGGNVGAEYIQRIQAYMTKALNEAEAKQRAGSSRTKEWLAARAISCQSFGGRSEEQVSADFSSVAERLCESARSIP